MTVLVTGGAGYIGSHMALLLQDRGIPFVIVDDMSYGCADLVPASADEFVVGDIGDSTLIESILKRHRIKSVIHFAGSILVSESVENPLKYFENNATKTQVLLESCRKCGIENFIFSSTAAVYGEPEQIPVAENSRMIPINPYGWSKLYSETAIQALAAATGMRMAILRYFNVAGADSRLRSGELRPIATHLINVATQVALGKRDQLSIFGADYETMDGTCVRDFVHVSDLAEAHFEALQYLQNDGENLVVNCGSGIGYSVKEVVTSLETILERPLPKVVRGRRVGDPPVLLADTARIREVLGWKPKFDLIDILRTAYDWEVQVQGGHLKSNVFNWPHASPEPVVKLVTV